MNKDCKRYLGELKTLIPSGGKYEKQFLRNMKENLNEFYCTNTDAAYNDVCTHFGTPQDIIISYFENVDTAYLIKRLKISSAIRKCVLCVILIAAITCAIEAGLFYKAYRDVHEQANGYWTETIY